MRRAPLAVLALLATVCPAFASEPFPAKLEGHIVIPAETFIDAPADAPADLKTSGKFTGGNRVDAAGSIEGKSFGRPTGAKYPFTGQPIQGHSGIKRMDDGTFWVITDNGFGTKANSPDSMLYLNQDLDRRRIRSLPAAGRPQRKGRGRVRNRGRGQTGAFA